MPCAEGTGACCKSFSSSDSPALDCVSCVAEINCLGQSCGGILNDWIATHPGDEGWSWFVNVSGPGGPEEHRRRLTATVDSIFHHRQDCNDLHGNDELFNPCGTAGACCFGDCEIFQGSHGCLSLKEQSCQRGWLTRLVDIKFLGPHGQGVGDIATNCRYRFPLNVICANFNVPTNYHPERVCRCTSTTEPLVPFLWSELGYPDCVRRVNDPRSWEDACRLIIDDEPLECSALGMPLVIDEDGFAAFDAGDKRTTSNCNHVLADLYVDSQGFARSLACPDPDNSTRVALGSLAFGNDPCTAMYSDYRWDHDFEC